MTSWDIATPTSLGTGVAKTEINGGQPITKPTQAQTLIEVVPYMVFSDKERKERRRKYWIEYYKKNKKKVQTGMG